MYVCLCKGLTERDVRDAGQGPSVNPESLVRCLGLDDEECCGRCAEKIDEIVTIATGSLLCDRR